MFLEPLVACRKILKSNWTFYNWAGPNFAPKISLLILAQTNNIYIYVYIYIHTINQEHQKPVVEVTTHKNKWIHSIGLMNNSFWKAFWKVQFLHVFAIWVWVKIRYLNNWMVNTKLDIHICGPTSVFHFDPHPSDGTLWATPDLSGHPWRASIFRVALWTLWLRSPSTACPKTRL